MQPLTHRPGGRGTAPAGGASPTGVELRCPRRSHDEGVFDARLVRKPARGFPSRLASVPA